MAERVSLDFYSRQLVIQKKNDLMLEENTNASFHKLVKKSGFYSSLQQSTCFQFQSQAFLSLKKSGEADAD